MPLQRKPYLNLFKRCVKHLGRVAQAQAEAGTTGAEAVAGQLKTQARQRQSVAEVLQREGVFTQAELDRLEYILDQGAKIQTAVRRGGAATDELIDEMGFFSDLLVRLGGAKFGTSLAQATGMSSQGLVEAGAGVRFAQNNFKKLQRVASYDCLKKLCLSQSLW